MFFLTDKAALFGSLTAGSLDHGTFGTNYNELQ